MLTVSCKWNCFVTPSLHLGSAAAPLQPAWDVAMYSVSLTHLHGFTSACLSTGAALEITQSCG